MGRKKAMVLDFSLLSSISGSLLESPVWDDERQQLLCCDIDGGLIFALTLAGEHLHTWEFDQPVASFGLCESGKLVVALARRVVLFDRDSGQLSDLWNNYPEQETSRLNDGKTGPDGAFWIGSMDGRENRQPISKLYRITADGTAEVKADGIEISNGLAWSSDAKTLFHSDSRGPWINRYDFDVSKGVLSNQTRILDLDEQSGRPDGAAMDTEGFYWSAGVSAGVLNRISHDGAIVECIKAPIPAPTMPCFCGAELRYLAITSHQKSGIAHEHSGRIFLAKTDLSGVPVVRMKGI
jgi:sugar lactone lactonase YvrE